MLEVEIAESVRWAAAFRLLGKHPVTYYGVDFYCPPGLDSHRCDLCGERCEGARIRMIETSPLVLHHEACNVLQVLGEWELE